MSDLVTSDTIGESVSCCKASLSIHEMKESLMVQNQFICPLCGANNQCVIAQKSERDISNCWCREVQLDEVKLKQKLNEFQERGGNESCICPSCAKHLLKLSYE